LAIAGDRRTFFRLRPNAFAAGERHRLQTMADLQQMAEVGLNALRGSGEERCRRLYEMRDLLSYMEKALTEALHQYRQPAIDGRGQEPGLID
jgi:hypothetical protein